MASFCILRLVRPILGLVIAFHATVSVAAPARKPPVAIVFDTDLGNDVDDALALAMIHALESRGECELLAVTVSKDHPLAAAFADAINRFYGRGDIPVGLVRNGATPEPGRFLQLATERDDGKLRYPNRFADGERAPDATEVLRHTLASAADDSVVMIQVGFSTNLSRLLASAADEISPLNGAELVREKVRALFMMAGAFEQQRGANSVELEYNVTEDIAAAKDVCEHWPTPIVWSGFDVGRALEYPSQSILKDFRYVPHHPIAEAYVAYEPPPHNRPTWDLTCVLQAVRPDRGYFGLSPRGHVTVSDKGRTTFVEQADGPHQFLTLSPDQIARVKETFVSLSSQPPTPSGAAR